MQFRQWRSIRASIAVAAREGRDDEADVFRRELRASRLADSIKAALSAGLTDAQRHALSALLNESDR